MGFAIVTTDGRHTHAESLVEAQCPVLVRLGGSDGHGDVESLSKVSKQTACTITLDVALAYLLERASGEGGLTEQACRVTSSRHGELRFPVRAVQARASIGHRALVLLADPRCHSEQGL